MYQDPPQRLAGGGRTDVSADGFLFYFHQRLSSCLVRQMRILCLFFLFVLALVFPLFSFSFVDKGRILSNLLTLSGALLSCSHHESFHPKFSCLLLFFYTVVYLCFALGFPVSLCYPWNRWSTFSACLFVATGYCDHFFFYPSCLSRAQ